MTPPLGLRLRRTAAVVFLAALATPVWALDFSGSAEGAYSSRYVFRGVKLGAGAFQPAVTAKLGAVDLGYWANHPLAREESLERDYTAGYSFSGAGLDWRAAGQWYTYPQAEVPLTRNSQEFSFGGSRSLRSGEKQDLVLAGTAFYDVRLEALTVELGLTQSWKCNDVVSVSAGLTAGHVNSRDLAPDAEPPKVGDGYAYGAAKLEVRVAFGKHGYARVGGQWDTTRGLNGAGADLGGNLSGWVAVGCEW